MSAASRLDRIAADIRPVPALRDDLEPPMELDELMRLHGVPGVSVAVVADGRIEARGWGVRKAGRDDGVDAATLFQAGSISKPVAALGALRLVARGELDLDGDVNDRLTTWKVPSTHGWQPRVTVRQLLSHTAGLTVHGFPGYARDEALPTLVDVLDGRPPANTRPVRVTTLPGLQFSYSGGGYCVLQQLLVDVTGTAFPQLLRELVLEPLGMRESGYEQPLPEERWPSAAGGHRTAGKPVHGDWHVYPEMAAAGLWTTPSDLARFVIGIQEAAAGAPQAILHRELAAQMLTPEAPNVSMGLGLRLEDEGPARRFGHGGDDEGFVAAMKGDVAGGRGAVAMTNGDGGGSLLQPILDAVGRAYDWPGSAARTSPADGAAVELDAYTGTFELDSGDGLRVGRRDDHLVLEFPGQSAVGLFPGAAGEWSARSLNLDVVFRTDRGTVTGLVIRQQAQYVEDVEARRQG